jgi:hypothetical protein
MAQPRERWHGFAAATVRRYRGMIEMRWARFRYLLQRRRTPPRTSAWLPTHAAAWDWLRIAVAPANLLPVAALNPANLNRSGAGVHPE